MEGKKAIRKALRTIFTVCANGMEETLIGEEPTSMTDLLVLGRKLKEKFYRLDAIQEELVTVKKI